MSPSSPRYRTGVVIGKFYPPHRGHSYLIDVAGAGVEQLTVIVCAAADQSIPGALRAAWLQELHPDARIMLVEDVYPPDDSALWARLTVGWLGGAPDVVYTSEDYGERYARLMGSAHVLVDRARVQAPCSGTQVRADPLLWWEYLAPPVRAYYCKRVCVLGAESSGTTTLARALAEHYQTTWAPEYGREYSVARFHRLGAADWDTAEFVHIAREQQRREDALAGQADRLLIMDTDAFATAVWHERYTGRRSSAVQAISQAHQPHLTIVTDWTIPFVQDGTRDGEHLRGWMHRRFISALGEAGRPYIVVAGSHDARMAAAIKAIDHLILSPCDDIRRCAAG